MSWTICYPEELKAVADYGLGAEVGKRLYAVNADTSAGFSVTFADEHGGTYVKGWRYTFGENAGSNLPRRVNIKEKADIKQYKIPFAARGGAINLGWDFTQIAINVLFTGTNAETRRDELFSVLKTARGWDGKDAMAEEEPFTAPFLLFCGAVNRLRFVYVNAITLIRDGTIGDNVWEYLISFTDWQPHEYNAAAGTDDFELDLLDEIDYTTFTEVDAGGDNISVDTYSKISYTDILRTESSYIHKAADSSISGDFTAYGSFKTTAKTGSGIMVIFGYGDTADEIFNSTNFTGIYHTGTGMNVVTPGPAFSDTIIVSVGTRYWWAFSRSGSTVSLSMYSDSARTSQVGATSTATEAGTYDRVFGISSFSAGGAGSLTGEIYLIESATGVSATEIDVATYSQVWIPSFGAGGGQTTPDASGNGNVGTIYGATKVDTPIGAGLDFDGVGNYVALPSTLASVDIIGDTVGTIAFWIRIPDATPAVEEYIVNVGDTNANEVLEITITTAGKIQVTLIDATTEDWKFTTDAVVFTADTWYRIALIQDGTSPILTVNGVDTAITFDTSTDKTEWMSALSGIDNFDIGRKNFNSTTGNYLAGDVTNFTYLNTNVTVAQELAKYNDEKPFVALTNSGSATTAPSQVKFTGATETDLLEQSDGSTGSEYTPPTSIKGETYDSLTYDGSDKSANCKLYYSTDMSISATHPQDESGNANHGTNTGCAETTNTWGDELTFVAGESDWIDNTNVVADVSGDTVGTILMWISVPDTTPPATQYLVNFGDTDADEFMSMIILTTGKITVGLKDGGVVDWNFTTDDAVFTVADKYYQICLVQNGTVPVLYVNGVDTAITFSVSTDTTEWLSALAGLDNFNIGRQNYNNGTGSYLSGSKASLTYLNTNLSAAQVLAKFSDEAFMLHRQTFIPTKDNLSKLRIDVDTDGGQDIAATVHDSSNNLIATGTIATGSTGERIADVPGVLSKGANYHFHLTVPSGTSKVETGTADDLEDCWFESFYAEHTKNPVLYEENNTDTKLEVGKESIDQEQSFDDADAGDIYQTISGTQDHIAQTFIPDQTSLSKVAIKGRRVNTPASLEVRIAVWDTDYATTIGNTTYWRTYLSAQEFSTTDGWLYAGNWYYTTDGTTFARKDIITGLDTTATYLLVMGLTANGADGTEYVLRKFGDANLYSDGALYVDGVTVSGDDLTFRTYYPDVVSVKIYDGSYIEINDDGTGTLLYLLVQADETKDIPAAFEVSGAEYDYTNDDWALVTAADYVTWRINSPFPMKNAEIDTITLRADGIIYLMASTDNSTWTVFRVFDVDGSSETYTNIPLGSAFDNKTELYIKAVAVGTDAQNELSDMDFYADLDTLGADMPSMDVGANVLNQSHDEISSGRAKIDLYWKERT